MSKIETYSKIDDYLSGQLSQEEKKTFEQSMQQDPELAGLVETQKQVNLLVVQDKLRSIHAKMKSDFSAGVPEKEIQWQGWKKRAIWGAGFGAVALTLWLVFPKFAVDTSTASTKHPEADTPDSVLTSSSSVVESTTANPMVPILKKEEKVESEKNLASTEVAKDEATVTDPVPAPRLEENPTSPTLVNNQTKTAVKECFTYRLSSAIFVLEGCAGKKEGSLTIQTQSWKNRKELRFSFDGSAFTEQTHYTMLGEGHYWLRLKDQQQCMDSALVEVREKICPPREAAFSPSQNDVFTLEVKSKTKILIRNRAGEIVFEKSLDGEDTVEWNGMDRNGNILPKGLYVVELEGGLQQEIRYVTIL